MKKFYISVTHLILRLAIVQNKFQQANKTKIDHINDNCIKFEVSLHFWGIWPTVRRWPAAPSILPKCGGQLPPPPPFIEAPDIKFMQAQENLFIQSSNKDLNVLQNLNCLSYMIPVFNHHFTDVSDLGYDLNTIWNWLWLYINVIVQILPQQQFGIFEKIQILPRNEDFNQSLTQKIT